jgi:hypothetical protein
MGALGNAWFVQETKMVDNADQEIDALTAFDPSKTAVVDKRFSEMLSGFAFAPDSTASIKLNSYEPNRLTYISEARTEQLAVFSEIYYDKGWKAFIDGKPADHFRANYVLRAMRIPAGKHEIEYRFEPKVFFIGEKISFASSLLLILLLLGFSGNELRKVMKGAVVKVTPDK